MGVHGLRGKYMVANTVLLYHKAAHMLLYHSQQKQMVWKSAIVIITQNIQMTNMASTKVTALEITNMATKASMTRFTEKNSVFSLLFSFSENQAVFK